MATKSDIIKKIVEKYSFVDKVLVIAVVDKFFTMLSETLKNHDRIEFRGFASFSIRSYSIVNRSISSKLKKNKYFKVYFRSSQSLSNLVNE